MDGQNLAGLPVVENALEMVLTFSASGKISYANASARKKLEYDNIIDKYIWDIFPNTFQAEKDVPEGTVKRGFHCSCPFGNETHNLVAYRKNLTCFPVEAQLLESTLNPGSYICMANDILEKEFLSKEIERVREEAQDAMKVKSEFVANVTHELRTPVNGVLGNVRELLEIVTDKELLRPLQLIERCCGDMNKIINNILDFSKLEAGKFTLELRKFHFRNMLDYVKSQHINKLNEKGLGFFMTVSPQIPEYVFGDELRIVQILNNLLSNAQKFTAVGKITVEVVRTAQVDNKMELFFIVKDTGIGIDKADRDKLFQSFSQVDASISRKYGGTGLGLNICKQLVELMGGRIEVESQKNKGSTFSFSVWVGISEEDARADLTAFAPAEGISDESGEEYDHIKDYGTAENLNNLKKNMSKLVLCVEMENWEKAEMFMETIRQLTENAPREVSREVLRLKMAVQKANYDKVIAQYHALETVFGS